MMNRPSPSAHEVTRLLQQWSDGNQAALDQLMPLVYDELRRLAHGYMRRERPDHTLDTTGLVHEAYLRLVDQNKVTWQNRAHFFAIAAQIMRRILVDYARRRAYAKREGEAHKVPLDEASLMTAERARELTELDDALTSLAMLDSRQSRVVELRVFGGLTIEETAEVLELSVDMVKREWGTARAWLNREMSRSLSG